MELSLGIRNPRAYDSCADARAYELCHWPSTRYRMSSPEWIRHKRRAASLVGRPTEPMHTDKPCSTNARKTPNRVARVRCRGKSKPSRMHHLEAGHDKTINESVKSGYAESMANQTPLTELALQWRSDYEFGVLDRQHVVQMCDSIIVENECPPFEIIELSLMVEGSEVDMIAHMRAMCPRKPLMEHRYRSLLKALESPHAMARLQEIQQTASSMALEYEEEFAPRLKGELFELELYVVNDCVRLGTVTADLLQEVLSDIREILAIEIMRTQACKP